MFFSDFWLPFWSFFGSGSFDAVTCLLVVSTYSFKAVSCLLGHRSSVHSAVFMSS